MASIVRKRCNCRTCGQPRIFEKQCPSHILHLLLSLVTAGMWIPVWIALVLANAFSPFRCTECGEGRL